MTKQTSNGQYLVFSYDKFQQDSNSTPAGRYAKLSDAIQHADSVTYRMVVTDSKAESRGFLYTNWEVHPTSSPWGQVQTSRRLGPGIWIVSTSSHGGVWLSEARQRELTEMLGYEYPTFCGRPAWFEEDCDVCVPIVAFGIDSHYEAACQQLRGMAEWIDNAKYRQAYDALVAAGRILDAEKVKQTIANR